MLQIDLYPSDAADLVESLGASVGVFKQLCAEQPNAAHFYRAHMERLESLQQQITLTYNEVVK